MSDIYEAKKDTTWAEPYIDIDEWRMRGDEDYRFVHGGFKNTNVKFAFYFPKKEKFKGRFFQHLCPFPGPDEEVAYLDMHEADDKILFALKSGAYFCATNMGSSAQFSSSGDQTIVYKSNAAVAEYSRVVAEKMYGCSRPYGYAYGGSGGGYKTISCIENTNAFDGGVPHVIGSPVSLPSCMTIRAHAQRILRNKYEQLKDNIEPGSNNELTFGLDGEEQEAFIEATKFGVPIKSWLISEKMDDGSLSVLAPGVKMMDPGYFKDFWELTGYLGADKNSSAVRDRICFHTEISNIYIPQKQDASVKSEKILNGVNEAFLKMVQQSGFSGEPFIEIEKKPDNENLYLTGLTVKVESGQAAGAVLAVKSIEGYKIFLKNAFGTGSVEEVLEILKEGDKVFLDNSDYIAIQTYHRHIVPAPEFITWDLYRDKNKNPIYPQRPVALSFGNGTGTQQTGDVKAKVIIVAAECDEAALPWQADWYRKKVNNVKGGIPDENVRLWYSENSYHDDKSTTIDELYVTAYLGMVNQALLDLSDWVERSIEPAKTTGYKVDDGQLILANNAQERNCIQSLLKMQANSEECAVVKAGESVNIRLDVELPQDCGYITDVEFSFDSEQNFPHKNRIEPMQTKMTVSETCTYQKPGIYFVTARVSSNRSGGKSDEFTKIRNLVRVRVKVK